MKNVLLKYGNDYRKYFSIFTEENIWEYKKLVNKHQIPFSIKAILKYFNSIDDFIKELHEN